ncbi:MAG: hypothetical protein WC297_03770 [Candidatus Paceibacterota bacterium]|jgi:hypothetical protein
MFTLPVTVGEVEGLKDLLLGNITTQFADAGTLGFVALAIGIPLAFYVIKRVIGLMPKGK